VEQEWAGVILPQRQQGNKMMAVDVTTQPSFSVSRPKTLFEGTIRAKPGMVA
jgi:hypothetical protein